MALRYTFACAPGVVYALVSLVGTYGSYSEFDRPRVGPVLPLVASTLVWCIAMACVVVPEELRPSPERLLLVAAAGVLVVAGLVASAPGRPVGQGLVLCVVTAGVPSLVWAVVGFPGVPALMARVVAGLLVVLVMLVASALGALWALSVGFPLPGAVVLFAIAMHVPVTSVTSLIGRPRPIGETATIPALAAVLAAVAVVLGAIGFVTRDDVIDDGNALVAAVARSHRDLNLAVGWDSWRPAALDDTADRLDRAARLAGNDPNLVSAAELVRRARRLDSPAAARSAHAIVADYERRLRGRLGESSHAPSSARLTSVS